MLDFQTSIAVLIVLAAALYLARHLFKGRTCETCTHRCPEGDRQADDSFVPIEELTQSVPRSCCSQSDSTVEEGARFES